MMFCLEVRSLAFYLHRSFEVGVSRLDAFFDIFASSYNIMCVDRLSYIFLCRRNPSVVPLNIPCASAYAEPMLLG